MTKNKGKTVIAAKSLFSFLSFPCGDGQVSLVCPRSHYLHSTAIQQFKTGTSNQMPFSFFLPPVCVKSRADVWCPAPCKWILVHPGHQTEPHKNPHGSRFQTFFYGPEEKQNIFNENMVISSYQYKMLFILTHTE